MLVDHPTKSHMWIYHIYLYTQYPLYILVIGVMHQLNPINSYLESNPKVHAGLQVTEPVMHRGGLYYMRHIKTRELDRKPFHV